MSRISFFIKHVNIKSQYHIKYINIFNIMLETLIKFYNYVKYSGNTLAVDGSARDRWERVRPIALVRLVADFLRKVGRLVRRVSLINDTFSIFLSGVSVLKLGRQLTEIKYFQIHKTKSCRRVIEREILLPNCRPHYSIAKRILDFRNFPPNVARIETLLYNNMSIIRRVVIDFEYSRELMRKDHVYGRYDESR